MAVVILGVTVTIFSLDNVLFSILGDYITCSDCDTRHSPRIFASYITSGVNSGCSCYETRNFLRETDLSLGVESLPRGNFYGLY